MNAYIKSLEATMEEAKALDPFWYFEPNLGEIDEEMATYLTKHLEPDDVPQKLDSQLDILLSEASIVGASGGNQSGKSTIGAISGYMKATGELPEALKPYADRHVIKRDIERTKARAVIRGRVVGVDFKQMNNTVLPAWKFWCPRSYLKNGSWTDSFSVQHQTLSLYRKNKLCATIEFMTNSQDKESFQGPPLDWLKYDEEPKEEIHNENMMRFTTADRLDIGFYWTPTNGISWATDLFDEELSDNVDDTEIFKLCSVTNKKANKDVLDIILTKITNYKEKKMRLLGEAVSLSGLVYGRLFDKSIHVVQPFFEDLTPSQKSEYMCIRGLDPHLVTSTACVHLLIDREGNAYVDLCYFRDKDTQEVKDDLAEIAHNHGYRLGWSVSDCSADTTIIAFGGRNIFNEISRGKNAIVGLRKSSKFEGSIKAGVDTIKQKLKVDERTGKPSLFVIDRPENKELIKSFRTLQRDTYANESDKGPKDRIKEGRHHLHASLRYIFQFPVRHYDEVISVPEPEFFDEASCY